MGKRYKPGNVGKSKNRQGRAYMEREAKINRLIKKFRNILFNKDNNQVNVYNQADRLRMNIKYLLKTQSKQIHTDRKSTRLNSSH